MRNETDYLITVLRCEESGMLVGRSTDIPGLNVEAATPRGIVDAIVEVAPRLMMNNLKLSAKEVAECSINVKLEIAPARQRQSAPRPHIFVDSDLVAVPA